MFVFKHIFFNSCIIKISFEITFEMGSLSKTPSVNQTTSGVRKSQQPVKSCIKSLQEHKQWQQLSVLSTTWRCFTKFSIWIGVVAYNYVAFSWIFFLVRAINNIEGERTAFGFANCSTRKQALGRCCFWSDWWIKQSIGFGLTGRCCRCFDLFSCRGVGVLLHVLWATQD